MLADMLNLASAVSIIHKTTVTDGMGGTTDTTSETVLAKAAIWQNNSNSRTLSEKVTRDSSHVLAYQSSVLTVLDTDADVIYNGQSYKIVGHPDDVANRGELTVVGLLRLS